MAKRGKYKTEADWVYVLRHQQYEHLALRTTVDGIRILLAADGHNLVMVEALIEKLNAGANYLFIKGPFLSTHRAELTLLDRLRFTTIAVEAYLNEQYFTKPTQDSYWWHPVTGIVVMSYDNINHGFIVELDVAIREFFDQHTEIKRLDIVADYIPDVKADPRWVKVYPAD